MPTHLITGPFPELWRGIEHEHLVLVDGHGLDGKPFLEGPRVEIAPVADILMEDIERDGPTIDALCEVLLVDLAESLNRIHGVEESLRYWRMVLAPWIRETVTVAYLRYKTLRGTYRRYPGAVLAGDDVPAPPSPRDHFETAILYHTPELRVWLYRVLNRLATGPETLPPAVTAEARRRGQMPRESPVDPVVHPSRWRFAGLTVVGSNWTPMSRVQLHLASRLLPRGRRRARGLYRVAQRDDLRADLFVTPVATEIETLRRIVQALLPLCLLEGWPEYRGNTRSHRGQGRVLLTNSGLQRDIELRGRAARHQEAGQPVCVVQEGGGFGIKSIPFLEGLEGDLADVFVTWGAKSHPLGVVAGVGSVRGLPGRGSPSGAIVIILGPRTTAAKDFGVIGRLPTSTYLSDVVRFVEHLPTEQRAHVVLRGKGSMGAWGPKDRISLRDSGLAGLGIALDENDEPVGDVIRRARLAIVTYNESLAPILISRDLPTMMLWNRRYVAASAAWQELSEILASAQMYFSDPVECARHVNEVADDVMGWWQSPIVRAARRRYCDDYARPLRRPGFTVGRTLRHALAPIPAHASAQRHG